MAFKPAHGDCPGDNLPLCLERTIKASSSVPVPLVWECNAPSRTDSQKQAETMPETVTMLKQGTARNMIDLRKAGINCPVLYGTMSSGTRAKSCKHLHTCLKATMECSRWLAIRQTTLLFKAVDKAIESKNGGL